MRKVAEVTIKGVSPLLINRPLTDDETGGSKKKTEVLSPKEKAELVNYYDPDLGCYVPNDMIKASIRDASKNFKRGRGNYAKTIKARLFVSPEKIPLNKETYDLIDKRPCRLPSNGAMITAARPRYEDWELKFNIEFEDTAIGEGLLKEILDEAGSSTCIGSYRPEFGRFSVSEFKVQSNT